jgi:EmrB/QacA subfamily drug resistance transporter
LATVVNPIQFPCGEAHALALAQDQRCAELTRKWVMLACIFASSLAFIDGTVVNVALPELQKIFSTTVSRVQWVLESYQLFSSALLLVGGALGDHYGRRRALGAGVLIFVAASIWCGVAQTINQLIVARAVEGVGAALIIPTSLSMLASAYPPELRGGAIGSWAAWTGLCAALGPVVGGWLIEHASWRLIFFLNVPVGAAVVLLLTRIPESRGVKEGDRSQLDWLGAALITLSLTAIVLGLLDGPMLGWSSRRVVVALVAGGVLLVAFLRVEATRPNAMMPLRLFHSREFTAANILTFFLYASLGGSLFFLPFYLIQIKHFSATAAGAAFLPFIALMFLFSSRVGKLMSRVGARWLLVVGAVIAGCGFALFGLLMTQPGYARAVLPAVLMLGIGMTLSVAPLTATVMNSVPQQENGVASGVNNALSRVAGLLAVAVLGAVLQGTFSKKLSAELNNSRLSEAQRVELYVQRNKLNEARLASASVDAQIEAKRALNAAFIAGFRRVMDISAAECVAGAIVVAFMIRRRSSAPRKLSGAASG